MFLSQNNFDSLYQKLRDVCVLGTKFVKSLFVQYWLLMPLRTQVEICSTGRVITKPPRFLKKGFFLKDFLKKQNLYILLKKTSHLMMMNKRNQETAPPIFCCLKTLLISSLLSLITCVPSTAISWPNTFFN